MTTAPAQNIIIRALEVAASSPCRSKRGVVLYDPATGAARGSGHNEPPTGCPGRATCAGTCGQRSVHAEVRALRDAVDAYGGIVSRQLDLVHVELAADGGVVGCDGPSCPGCAAQILDAGFVGGVWLYLSAKAWRSIPIDLLPYPGIQFDAAYNPVDAWARYTAEEFYAVTMKHCVVQR